MRRAPRPRTTRHQECRRPRSCLHSRRETGFRHPPPPSACQGTAGAGSPTGKPNAASYGPSSTRRPGLRPGNQAGSRHRGQRPRTAGGGRRFRSWNQSNIWLRHNTGITNPTCGQPPPGAAGTRSRQARPTAVGKVSTGSTNGGGSRQARPPVRSRQARPTGWVSTSSTNGVGEAGLDRLDHRTGLDQRMGEAGSTSG